MITETLALTKESTCSLQNKGHNEENLYAAITLTDHQPRSTNRF